MSPKDVKKDDLLLSLTDEEFEALSSEPSAEEMAAAMKRGRDKVMKLRSYRRVPRSPDRKKALREAAVACEGVMNSLTLVATEASRSADYTAGFAAATRECVATINELLLRHHDEKATSEQVAARDRLLKHLGLSSDLSPEREAEILAQWNDEKAPDSVEVGTAVLKACQRDGVWGAVHAGCKGFIDKDGERVRCLCSCHDTAKEHA